MTLIIGNQFLFLLCGLLAHLSVPIPTVVAVVIICIVEEIDDVKHTPDGFHPS